MDPIRVVEIGTGRWLVTTTCHECFIDVAGSSDKDPKWTYVQIALLSGHNGNYAGRLRQRIPQAWRMLRGTDGRPWMEMFTRKEVEGLVEALRMASNEAFQEEDA